MLFSCHFQILLAISEIQLTLPYVLYVLDVKSAVSLQWPVGFENGMKMTPIFTIIFISKMLIIHLRSFIYNYLFAINYLQLFIYDHLFEIIYIYIT